MTAGCRLRGAYRASSQGLHGEGPEDHGVPRGSKLVGDTKSGRVWCAAGWWGIAFARGVGEQLEYRVLSRSLLYTLSAFVGNALPNLFTGAAISRLPRRN